MPNNQLIILGSGSSVQDGLSLGLFEKLKDKFVLGINRSFRYFIPTAQCMCDHDFYKADIENLSKLPLVIARRKAIDKPATNTILIPTSSHYHRDLKDGVYRSNLTGLFTLSLGIALISSLYERGECFLLGFDCNAGLPRKDATGAKNTHFFQTDKWQKGIGKTSYYDDKAKLDRDFGVYKEEKLVKIYNVSPKSRLTQFEKIDYPTFFSMLNPTKIDQEYTRTCIKTYLKSIF